MSEPSTAHSNAQQRPELAVSAAIFRDLNGPLELLLVRRTRSPARGLFTLPGGRVEFGETLHEALIREVREETALAIDIVGLAGWRDAVAADPAHHFVILPFAARWLNGDVALNDELDDFRWIEPEALGDLPTTDGLAEIIGNAVRVIQSHPLIC